MGGAERQRRPARERHGLGLRVLVVDDYPDNVESMALLLRLAGHEVEGARAGPAALHLAQQYRPHVVLCDLSMPGMSGLEVARQLRRELGRGVLLVAITACGQEEDRRRCLEAGFDRFFVKPADPDSVLSLLRGASGLAEVSSPPEW